MYINGQWDVEIVPPIVPNTQSIVICDLLALCD